MHVVMITQVRRVNRVSAHDIVSFHEIFPKGFLIVRTALGGKQVPALSTLDRHCAFVLLISTCVFVEDLVDIDPEF